MTKQEYMHRPDDIKLPPTWEAMRQNQRELSWPAAYMNSLMANSKQPIQYYGYASLTNVFGLGKII